MNKNPKKLLIIDGNAIIHRSYHALPPLTTKKGEIVNAVYGFTTTLLNVLEKFKPDYIIVTFDLAGPTFRHEEYSDYKATRVKAPDDLYAQIPRVKEIVRAFNIPIYEKQGFEADDVIGTVVKLSEKCPNDIENIIVTGDLDTLQLVSDKTKVYTMRRGLSDSVIYDEEKVMERFGGLKPTQLTDYKGLRGDASDNIPGVKGIGEKTAIELLNNYKTLENVYKNLADIKPSTREKLERDKMMAIKSKKLGEVHCNVPIDLDFSAIIKHSIDKETLANLFKELEFYSLIKRIPDANLSVSSAGGQMHTNAANKEEKFHCEIVEIKNINKLVRDLEQKKEMAIYLNVLGEKVLEREIRGMAISWEEGQAFYVPYSKDNFSPIKPILENPEIKKIGYDLKNDVEVLRLYDIKLAGLHYDVMLAAYTLNPGSKIELPTLVLAEIGEELVAISKKGQLELLPEPVEEISRKAGKIADYILKLKRGYSEKIKSISHDQTGKNNLETVFSNLEMPLVSILASMELYGVKLNTIIFQGISEKINKRLLNLEKSIYQLVGKEFNINSPRQLADILFIDLKIPASDIKKGKTGYSTASTELQKIKDKHPIIEKIEDYREIFKLKTTYLDTMPLLVDKDSRLHARFNQAVTATGRLSSSEPNLQNIPIRTELGELMRTAFEAQEGYKLIAADYSQIDLRVMAHVSGDKKLIELFHAGEDIHRATASLINNVSLSQVTDRMRRGAKELNFGVIYGISPFGFAMRAGVDRDQAKKFIDEYFEKFPGVANFMKKTKEFAKTYGYVETELGRRRYVPEINSPNFQVAASGERMAINMPIQGMSADIMKLAMIAVTRQLSANYNLEVDVRMILQVHDEIILEVREDISSEVALQIKKIMESVYNFRVPLVVDVEVGDNWGEV